MEIYVKKKSMDRYGIFPGAGLLFSPFAKILTITLIAGLLSSGVFSVFKVLEVKDLQLEVAEQKNTVTFLTGQLAGCNVALEDQNQELIEIAAKAEADINAIKDVNKQLDGLTKVQRFEIKELRSRPAPQNCEDSKEWLKENLNIFEDQK